MPPVYFPDAAPIVPNTALRTTDDYKSTNAVLYREHWATNPGSNAAAGAGDAVNTLGRFNFSLGTAGVSRAIRTGIFWLPFSTLFLWQTALTPDVLSGSGVTYRLQIGLTTGEMSTLPTAGVGFSYTDTENAGRWQAFFINGAQVETFDTLSLANVTRNAFRIYSPGPSGPFVYMVNDVVVGAVTPQAPFAVPLRTVIGGHKIASATARNIALDYYGAYWMRPDITG